MTSGGFIVSGTNSRLIARHIPVPQTGQRAARRGEPANPFLYVRGATSTTRVAVRLPLQP